MKLPMLFKLTEVGNTQQWEIIVDGSLFYTREGIIDGAITESKPTECAGKNVGRSNETSPDEQALKEAKAKWQKKLDKGYFLTREEAESGATKFYEPMLAHKYEDYVISYPVYSQPKLDGIRCIATKDGLFSRTGKKFVSVPHIEQALKDFFDKDPTAILDGELYCDKLNNDFNTICSLAKKTKPTEADLENSKVIEYWVYDTPRISTYRENHVFAGRYLELENRIYDTYGVINVLETTLCDTSQAVDCLYEQYIQDGYEGQIIRKNGPYENKRSKNLLKRKEFIDEEYEILGVVEGLGNRSKTAGCMLFKTKSGAEFRSNIKGTFEYLEELYSKRDSLVGKLATIKYFNLTPDGIPRFPYVVGIRDYE